MTKFIKFEKLPTISLKSANNLKLIKFIILIANLGLPQLSMINLIDQTSFLDLINIINLKIRKI